MAMGAENRHKKATVLTSPYMHAYEIKFEVKQTYTYIYKYETYCRK